jgi:hypothetical protein
MLDAQAPIEIFCSYAHADERWFRKLETHLSLLKRQGLIALWHDRQIDAGVDQVHAIDAHLESASVILLLISSDYMASDYCYGIEMQRALERHQSNKARVIPILIRPIDWQGTPFKHLHALPTDARPITTWNNKDQAFADVAAGIRRAIGDLFQLSASIPAAPLPTFWNIPYPRNIFFTGREGILSRLRTQLQSNQVSALSQPQAISGLGGVGKTQIAIEYAYRFHQDYQAVLWARAESREALLSSFTDLAALLRLPEQNVKDQMIAVQAVKTWLQAHSHWLLILDNADELSVIAGFLPPALPGHVLLTTRAAALGRLASCIDVDTLSSKEGEFFLLRRAALLAPHVVLEQASPRERELASRVVQMLGGLPLALDQAGAYLEETGCGLSEYMYRFEDHRTNLLKERRGLVADHPEPVATTWSLSFERVQQKNPTAADMLRLCAFLAPDAIPLEIMKQVAVHMGATLEPISTNALLLDQAIEVLRAYSLLQRDPATSTLSIHRLVQAVLQDAMTELEREQWLRQTIRGLNTVFSAGGWWLRERLIDHVTACSTAFTRQAKNYQRPTPLNYELANLLRKVADHLEEPIDKR